MRDKGEKNIRANLTIEWIWKRIGLMVIGLWIVILLGSSLFGQTNTFDGSTNANWNTASNWSLYQVPNTAHNVVIPNNLDVTINTNAQCASFTINGGNRDNTITITATNSLTVTNGINIGAGTGGGDNKIINVGTGSITCNSINISATGSAFFSSGITLSTGTINVAGNITMGDANDDFTFTGAGVLNIGGNMSGGTFTASTSTVNYNGSGAQNVGDYTYYNLSISGGNTKTIQGDVTVNNILNLNDGNLSLGAGTNNLIIGNAGIITGTYNNTHMIVCDGNGSVIRQGNTIADYNMVYPIGTGTYYTPVQISNFTASDASGDISIRAVTGIAPGPPAANSTDLQKYWVISSTGLTITNADLSFTYINPGEIGTGGDQSTYKPYLYNGGSWSMPTGGSSGGVNPMTVTGLTNINGIWTGREGPKTYYSYQSGNWGTNTTWTTDPSGTLSVDPGVPGALDRVVILNGRTVTTTTGYTVLSTQINEGGFLDIANTTGHNFGDVRGKGWLRLSTGTFPAGNFTSFVAEGGGTVEYYNNASFTLSQYTYNNLIFNSSTSGIISTVLGNLTVNGNLSIQRGNLRINSNAGTSRLDLTISGDVLVESNGLISLGTGAIGITEADAHRFIVKGDFTNNGDVRFTNLNAANYFNYPNTRVDVVFNNSSADQDLLINGYSRFYRIEINKGTDQTFILNIDATAPNLFYLFGLNDNMAAGPVPDAPNINNTSALGLMAGTVRLGTNITLPSLAEEEAGGDWNYIIDEDACLWIDGADVTHTTHANGGTSNSFVVYGKLKMTNPASVLTINNEHGIVTRANTAIEIQDGTLSTPCIRTSTVAGIHRGSYNQSGGTVTITGNLNGSDNHPSFSFTYPDMSFKMSGGNMIINQATDGGTAAGFSLAIGSRAENNEVTGGTVRIITANRASNFTSTAPFWNLIIEAANNTWTSQILDYPASGNSANVPPQPLVVLNDFSLLNYAGFIPNDQNVTVGGDFIINNNSVYTPGINTTTFNGISGQLFTNNGTITAGLYNFNITTQSNTSITQNLTIRNRLTIESNCFLQDMGRYIYVTADIMNSGTHISQAGGGIMLNSGGAQTIGGDGNGVFGNLIINKTAGLASLNASQELTGNLRLVNGLLNIGTFNLSLGAASNVYDALNGTSAVFSGAKMIRTAGNMSDGGVTKDYNSTTAFIFPIGTATDYTPATIHFSSAPLTWGSVNVKPISQYNPFVTSTNSLNYYWKVTQTGFSGIPANSVSHTYRYADSDLIGRGNEALYIPGVYNPYSWVFINDISQVADASNDIRFTNVSYVNGDFTAGEISAFQPVKVFYSRTTGDWNNTNTWSSVAVGGAIDGALPGTNNPVVIGDGNTFNHTVTVPAGYNNITIGGLQINSGSVLDITTSTGHNFGAIPDSKVSGTGILRISSAAAVATFPGGDFGNFLTAGGGTVVYYNTGAVNFTIPATKTFYNNLTLSPVVGRVITMPDINIAVYGNYSINGAGEARLNAISSRILTVYKDINVLGGTLQYYNGTAQTISANQDINISNGAVLNVRNGGTAVNNELYISGNLNNNGTFDMYNSTTLVCNVYFTGVENKVISGSGTNEFNYLTVDKGTSRNTILDVTTNNLSLSGAGTALVLENGTFRVSNSLLNFLLSTTTFTIPITAALSVNEGTVTIGTTSNAGDLILAGRLEIINNGVVNIGTGGDYNNDIEYASGGNPEIIITGNGTLSVTGQIRRPTTITTGALNYTQGGTSTVTIAGRQAVNTRGMFEVLNQGSSFNMSGGTLTILRNFNSATNYELLINPGSANVTGGTIRLGSAAVTGGTAFNFVSSASLYNLIVDATGTIKTVNQRIFPITLLNTLTIEGNSVYSANGLDVNIGGSLINNNSNAGTGISVGGYQPGSLSQVTTFNGTGLQLITSNSANLTNFANLILSPSTSVTLSPGTNIRINEDLTLNSGVLNDGSNNITVIRNITNSAVHTSPSTSGGIILAGAQKQIISGNGIGTFGNVTLNNSLGIDMVDNSTINGRLTFSNGILYIDDYLLTLGIDASISGTSDNNNMIMLNGVISDQGVIKHFAASPSDFTFPVGIAGKYTPARFNITANSAPGTILIRPINFKHPSTFENPAATNELQYYWNAVSTGFNGLMVDHEYHYISGDALPNETNYAVGKFTVSDYSWSAPITGIVNAASDYFTISGVDYIDGEYTCGVNVLPSPNFQTIPIYYSRNATLGGNWTNPASWTLNSDGSGGPASSYPQGNTAIILAGHNITLNVNSQVAYAVEINGTLTVGTFLYHSLGHIRGGGTMSVTSTGSGSFILPAGDYEDFMNNSTSTIDFYNNSAIAATLPLKPGNDYKPFQNVTFSGNGVKYISAENIRILGNLTIGTGSGTLNNTLHNKNITILGNWTDNNTSVTGGFVPGAGNVIFSGSTAQTIGITGATTIEQFFNFQINNPAGVIISGNGQAAVSRNLYLTLGNITTTETNLLNITNSSPTAVIGGGSFSFVNGPLKKQINSGSYFNYPVGDATRYGNIYLSSISATGNYICRYYDHNPIAEGFNPNLYVNPIDVVSNIEYWSVNGPVANANVRIRWDDHSGIIPPSAASRTKLRIVEWNGSAWESKGNLVNDGGQTSGTIETNPVTPVNTNHYFTIGVESLPTVDITSGNSSFCNDGVGTATITVVLTGTAPWTLRYRVNGANETTINNIATSPFNIVLGSTSPGMGAPGNYVYNMCYISDATGATGVRDFTETVSIQVNAAPNPVISGLVTLPLNSSTNYSVTNVPGNTYNWTASGNGTINSGGTTYQANVIFTSLVSGWVRVTETMPNECSVTTTNYVITLTDIPAPVVSGNINVCENGLTETYTTPNVPGHTYLWTLPLGGGTIVGGVNNLSTVEVNWTGTGARRIRVTETGSSAISNNLDITVNPQPLNTLAVSNQVICLGQTANIIVTGGEAGSDYILRMNDDNSIVVTVHTTVAGDVTLPVTPGVDGSIEYNVLVTNEYSCSSQLSDISTITVNLLPATGPLYRQPNN